MAPTPGQTKKFGEKLLSRLKKSVPYLAATGTGIAGGIGGYHLGKAVERRNDIDEDRQIAEQFYNLGERNSIMKTSELIDSVYDQAFTNELEKLGAKNPAELAKKVMPWVKNVFGKAKGGVSTGIDKVVSEAKDVGQEYKNLGKGIPGAFKKERMVPGKATQMGGEIYTQAPQKMKPIANAKWIAKDIGNLIKENKKAAIATGVGTVGIGATGVALAHRKKD